MEKLIKMPSSNLTPVISLLVKLGVYVEELAVSDTYVYRDLSEWPHEGFRNEYAKKFKLDNAYIYTRNNPNIYRKKYNYLGEPINENPSKKNWANCDHWAILINPEDCILHLKDKEPAVPLSSKYYKVFRINKAFIGEIIKEIDLGNRKNYTKMKGISRIAKKKEAVYNEWRINTLRKLQFVINEDSIVSLLEEQARKLQESGLATV